MIRRAAERNWRTDAIQGGEIEVEPGRVLDREPLRKQVLVGVIEVELGLNARNVLTADGERDKRLLELIGLGPILRVVKRKIRAARIREAIITGARFPLRPNVGHDEALEMIRQ